MKKIIKGIYWIGINDPKSKNFHEIPTPRGGSYNSYLIIDEKPTIIDTTNKKYLKKWLRSLKSKINPKKIDYIVINHAEPDHTGAIKEIMQECSNATILCTEKCKEFITAAFDQRTNIQAIKDNEEINIGKRTLKFIIDPMVHWPETMVTYVKEDKMLFSSDLYATEIAHEKLYADQMKDFTKITRDYYALVMRPLLPTVKIAIEKTKQLEIKLLAPSHGPIYRKNIDKIIQYYEKLSNNPEEDKVLIVYSSIWHGTERMAHEIAKGVENNGFKAVIQDIKKFHLVEIMAEALTSRAIAVGSLTILGRYHPDFEAMFPFLQLNNQKGKIAVVFGTHGWAPAAVPKLKAKLQELEYNVIGEIDYHFSPKTEDDYAKLRSLGEKLVKGGN
jgi:flavorubredoxin